MTLNKPEAGEQFGHTGFEGPLTYVGVLSDGSWVVEADCGSTHVFASESTSMELFPYLEPVEPLERGQKFKRTRQDHMGHVAEVLAVFEGRPHGNADGSFCNVWVAYHVHYGNGDREPKIKDETSFRRIFGKRTD